MQKYPCEILAPAGNLSDIESILQAGADAIYVGLKGFSSRPMEADLTVDEIEEARRITRAYHARLHVAINAAAKEDTIPLLLNQIRQLDKIGLDAFILSDLGLLSLLRRQPLQTPIHISTLTGVYNSEAVRLLLQYGISRLILSSDLFLDEILSLTERFPQLEFEIVADGGICFNSNRQCVLPHVSTMENYTVYCQMDYDLVRDGQVCGPAKRIGNCPAKIHRTMGLYLGLGICSFKIEGRTNPLPYILQRVREMKESKQFYEQHAAEIPGYMHYIRRNAAW